MKNINAGSVIIVAAVIVVALIILGFVSTLLTNIVPLTIVAIVAYILGRNSHNVDYLQVVGNFLKRVMASRPQAASASSPVVTTTATVKPAEKPAVEATSVSTPERQKQAETNLADFEVKTEEEILAEARLREEEILKGKPAYDPSAALEERRRRLLGDKTEE